MAAAVPFIMIAAAAVSAYGAVQQGKAAKAAATFNAQVSDQNAQVSREEAQAQARQQDRETYQRLGAVRAAQGKNGGVANEGSVLDVIGDVAAQGELQKQNIQYEGELKARGFTNTSTLDRASGATAQRNSYSAAGSELLNGASNAYSASSKLKRA